MGKLGAFLFISLDGYFKGPNEDIIWHNHDPEGTELSIEGLSSGSTLIFGRTTYQMMASFWTSPNAMETMKPVADGMNNNNKIVFSRTLEKADWNNTRLVKDNLPEEIKRLKQQGTTMTILGSGSILTQCASHGLLDELQLLVDPVAIGNGTSIFKGLEKSFNLKLTGTRTFSNGAVLLNYKSL